MDPHLVQGSALRCLICNLAVNFSVRTIITCPNTNIIEKLVRYPNNLGGWGVCGRINLKIEGPTQSVGAVYKEPAVAFCTECTDRLEEIGRILVQLEELHQRVTLFQKELLRQTRSTLVTETPVGGTSPTGARQRIVKELELQLGFDSPDNIAPVPSQRTHEIIQSHNQPVVKLWRLEQDPLVGQSLVPIVEIKQEPDRAGSPPSEPEFSMELDTCDDDYLGTPTSHNKGDQGEDSASEDDDFVVAKASTRRRRRRVQVEVTGCGYPDCEFTCKLRNTLREHVRKEHSGEFMCFRCGACFPDQPDSLASHEQSHLAEEKARTPCPYCPRTYPDLARQRQHQRRVHPEQPMPPWPADLLPKKKSANPVATEWTCPHCQKVFKPPTVHSTFKNHVASHTKPFKCTADGGACTTAFGSSISLRAHCIRAHPELQLPTYKCPYPDCPFESRFQSSVRTHVVARHETERSLPCTAAPGCAYRAPNGTSLRNHVEKVHEGKKNFLCTECGRSFYFKNALRLHMQTHTGERPFVCSACGRGYTTARQLRDHEAIKHRQERPHVCDHCGEPYCTKKQLWNHVRSWHHNGSVRIGVRPGAGKGRGRPRKSKSVSNSSNDAA